MTCVSTTIVYLDFAQSSNPEEVHQEAHHFINHVPGYTMLLKDGGENMCSNISTLIKHNYEQQKICEGQGNIVDIKRAPSDRSGSSSLLPTIHSGGYITHTHLLIGETRSQRS